MHRKGIISLKRQAAANFVSGKKKEAYELWAKADQERKSLQATKKKNIPPVKTDENKEIKNGEEST